MTIAAITATMAPLPHSPSRLWLGIDCSCH
jgi:hypothetical protein